MAATPPLRLSAGTLKPLAVRSDGPAARHALGHLGAIALTGVAVLLTSHTVWAVPLTVLLGYMLAFLFNALHESAHQTAFHTRRYNYFLGHVSGLVILLPYEYYRAFHWDHHRYTQDPEKDPELSKPLPTSRLGLLWYLTSLPTWRDRLRMLFGHGVLGRVTAPWVSADMRARIVTEARCYLGVYAGVVAISIATRSLAALWLWVLPVMLGQLFLRPYLLAEHTGCARSPNMLDNTRTTYTNAFVRFFAWNMPYHAEHHAYPAVPFHALPRLNALLREHITHNGRGYRGSTAAVLRHLRETRGYASAPTAADSSSSPS
jgi:fatty acid desaturase